MHQCSGSGHTSKQDERAAEPCTSRVITFGRFAARPEDLFTFVVVAHFDNLVVVVVVPVLTNAISVQKISIPRLTRLLYVPS